MKQLICLLLLLTSGPLSNLFAYPTLITTKSLSTKSLSKVQSIQEAGIPIGIIILVVGLIVLFTFLLLFSYKGSRRNRKKKKTIFG